MKSYKEDYTGVKYYVSLKPKDKLLFEEVWENIKDWAHFNGILLTTPDAVYRAKELSCNIVDVKGNVVQTDTYIFNLTDIKDYINELSKVESIQSFLKPIGCNYVIDSSKSYLCIEAKQSEKV